MKEKTIKFPKDFLWGVSTSAYQIEGGIKNDWSGWEKSPERVKQLKKAGKNPADFICGQACDSYNKHEEDIKLVKELNCGAYRFGIEWARIEPQEGKFDKNVIKHYRQMLKAVKAQNLKVVLTLWHWTNPSWLANQGGWYNKKSVEAFTRYTEFVINELGDLVDYWITMNEPMVHVLNGHVTGIFPPNKKSLFKARRAFKNLAKAHIITYEIIHRKYPKAQVSITKLTNYFEPARKFCLNEVAMAKLAHYFWNHKFLSKIKDSLDFIGLDYYFHDRIIWRPPFIKNKNEKITDMGWEIYPKGLYKVLKYVAKFKKPIMIIENGLADEDDNQRADFIKEHLRYIHKAIDEGIDVIGYFHWSLLDNFEWAEGYGPKFGLYSVNRKTLARTARSSAKVYAQICKKNEVI